LLIFRTSLAAAAIIILIISVIAFQTELATMMPSEDFIYDQSILEVIEKIDRSIPTNETLVVSTLEPHFVYFTDRRAMVPWTATSEESLVSLMRENGHQYLVVVENVSAAPQLDELFSSAGLESLDLQFDRLESYESDYFRLHLYKLRFMG
jgi:hypothetical protein